jgi:hypothetical protein
LQSISIVHNGYAVASNSTRSDVAFCLLYTAGHRYEIVQAAPPPASYSFIDKDFIL